MFRPKFPHPKCVSIKKLERIYNDWLLGIAIFVAKETIGHSPLRIIVKD